MWWNVLIIPNGYRYKVMMGEGNFDILSYEYKSLESRAKIKFVFSNGKNPEKLTYNEYQDQKELNDLLSKTKLKWGHKHKVSIVPSQILGVIKSTEPDHLDVLVKLDVENTDDFAMTYGSGEKGGIDILNDGLSNELMLVHSSLNELKSGLKQDYRYHKLSSEGKKEAMNRVKRESQMKDSQRVIEWIDRLQVSIDLRNKKMAATKENFASVFDGLK